MNNSKLDGSNLAKIVDSSLAPYAQKNGDSAGRSFPESTDPNRLPFQRDRDRIIHTTAFRRLRGKMQVLPPSQGDHYRNRLSHTLEVTQIARDLARQLQLNEDLVEAIALAHDIGHPPFGHAGEQMLNQKMQEFGQNFDHNLQSIRVVDFFERRYKEFPGLNLSREVIEGLAKHDKHSPHLESQLVDISDEIAYLSADIEDGLRGNFFTLEQLQENQIVKQALSEVLNRDKTYIPNVVRQIMRVLLRQIIKDSQENIKKYKIKDLASVKNCENRIIYLNTSFYVHFRELKQFLFTHFYLSPEVEAVSRKGQRVISGIFDYLVNNSEKMPKNFLPEVENCRRVCDYIAGMTDQFAIDFKK